MESKVRASYQARGAVNVLLLGASLLSCESADKGPEGASGDASDSGTVAESGDPGDPGDPGDSADAEDPHDTDSGTPAGASWEEVRSIIEAHCSRCHSAHRLSTYRRLETQDEVLALRTSILEKIEPGPPNGQRMPLASNHTDASGCTPSHPQINEKRLTDSEKSTLIAFLERTDHLDDADTYPPLSAPDVPALADAVAYTSTQFDVLNDGPLDRSEEESDEYMPEYSYDEREYDQMEDDWFCIRFNPERAEASHLTGVQVLTESGQIYLNSQLFIDTTGASEAAQAAAEEKGTDWYRCDSGLGFADAIPLWRTVPGGDAVELPDATGLRFAPGWTFVLRADFHTHFDFAEFRRLEQDGVIDEDLGTIIWHNRATLRARWAAPDDVTRELGRVNVGPSTEAERDAFAVVPGESTLTYTARPPIDPDTEYAVFSAEVGMGKLGHVASLVDSTRSNCIANNSDFSPKWIEQAIYAEDDAPNLDATSVLELTCAYRNPSEDSVTWDGEGEATVWGRKERCSAEVYYYPVRYRAAGAG